MKKSVPQIFFCVLWFQMRNPSWERPYSKETLVSQSLAMPGRGHVHGPLREDITVSSQACLMAPNRWQVDSLHLTKVSRKQSWPDLSFLCLSNKDGGNHPSDPSYSTSSSKAYWLTSGDNTLPFLSFSSTLFLRLCSWSFSFWRAWTCSEIFIFSSAVLLWSCTFFSDNSWSNKIRRVDIFKLSVFKA